MNSLNWTNAKLRDVCSEIVDGTHKTPKYVESGIRFISIANIKPYQPINFDSYERFITKEEHQALCKRVKPQENDILFPRIGTLGYAKRIDCNADFSIFVGLGLARPIQEKILPKFLEFYLNTREVYKYSCENAKGTGRLTLPLEASRNMPIRYPSLPEQERIVARIEELFSELDKAVETLQTTKQQLAVYRQAVLKEAFDSATMGDTKLVPILSIEQFLTSERKGMATGPFGTMIKKHEHKSSGIPMLGIENIGEGKFIDGNKIFVTSEKAEELKSFVLHEGDIIISRSGTVGEICAVPKRMEGALLSTNLMRVSLNNTIIRSDYFIYLFQSKGVVLDQVKELCKGSTRVFLNQTILKQIQFPVPTVKKQKEIVETIEARLSVCESIEKTVDTALQQAEALRQSILKQAFEGTI